MAPGKFSTPKKLFLLKRNFKSNNSINSNDNKNHNNKNRFSFNSLNRKCEANSPLIDYYLFKQEFNTNFENSILVKGNLKYASKINKLKNYFVVLRKQITISNLNTESHDIYETLTFTPKCYIEGFKDATMKKLKFFIDLSVIQKIDYNKLDFSILLCMNNNETIQLKANDNQTVNIWLNKICQNCGFYEMHKNFSQLDNNDETLIIKYDRDYNYNNYDTMNSISDKSKDDSLKGSIETQSIKSIAASVAESVGSYNLCTFLNDFDHLKTRENNEIETSNSFEDHIYDEYIHLDDCLSGDENDNYTTDVVNQINNFKNAYSSVEYFCGSDKKTDLRISSGSIDKLSHQMRQNETMPKIESPVQYRHSNTVTNRNTTQRSLSYACGVASIKNKKTEKSHSSNGNIKKLLSKSPSFTESNLFLENLDSSSVFSDSNLNFNTLLNQRKTYFDSESNYLHYVPLLDVVNKNKKNVNNNKNDYEKITKNYSYIDENSTRYTELDSLKTIALHNTINANTDLRKYDSFKLLS